MRGKVMVLGITGLACLAIFQNCGQLLSTAGKATTASISTPDPGLPLDPQEPPPALAKSQLTYKSLFEATVPGCFGPESSATGIRQSTMEYKTVHSDSLNKDFHLRAYVHQPPGQIAGAARPVVAIFHGGGWVINSPAYWFPLSFYLASRGVVAINFQYRLHTTPYTVERRKMPSKTGDRRCDGFGKMPRHSVLIQIKF